MRQSIVVMRRLCVAVIAAQAVIACSDSRSVTETPTPPSPETPNLPALSLVHGESARAATVGQAFVFRLAESTLTFSDPTGAGLTYDVRVIPEGVGLSVSGGDITGVPTTGGMITATVRATDSRGQNVEARFPIIAFRDDLGVPSLPAQLYGYTDENSPLPPAVANSPNVVRIDNNVTVENRITDAGATLGRVLFYDKRLSGNDLVSCASCHQQAASFSDTAQFSVGVQGARTSRHSMPLTNARFYGPKRFFRDQRAASLEDLALQPVFDATEMGLAPAALLPKLQLAGFYGPLYAAAFGDSTITPERTAQAIAQFVRALKPTHSRADSILVGTADMTPLESDGQGEFGAMCLTCHEAYVVVSDTVRNNGLDRLTHDPGAGAGRFKAPSLRNVALRPPYMHDGRFKTLDEVIDFYDSGVQDNPDLDPLLRDADGKPKRLHLTPQRRAALMAFLESLSDRSFLTDPRFSDPFRATSPH